MIVVKTPLRISFFGGGTDLPHFYHIEPGAVVSAAINKFMYVMINKKFDKRIRLSYNTITENIMTVDDIQHDIIRNALKMTKTDISNGLEIVTIADVPARGTGLGSSSALSVGLICGLARFGGWRCPEERPESEWLADLAFELETNWCDKPIGKQDQYACATGGINMFRFYPDEKVETIHANAQKRLINRLRSRMLLFKLPADRKNDNTFYDQKDNVHKNIIIYRKLADLAEQAFDLIDRGELDSLGKLLHANWRYKKELYSKVTTSEIDSIYEKALLNGADGGKVLGAGGGGFILFFAQQDKHQAIIKNIGLPVVDFNFTQEAAHIVYNSEDDQ